jgi:hypothetical protein
MPDTGRPISPHRVAAERLKSCGVNFAIPSSSQRPGVLKTFLPSLIRQVPRSAFAIAERFSGVSPFRPGNRNLWSPPSVLASSKISIARSESGWLITRRYLTRRAGISTQGSPLSWFSSLRWMCNASVLRSMVVNTNLIANLCRAVPRQVGAIEAAPQRPDLVLA